MREAESMHNRDYGEFESRGARGARGSRGGGFVDRGNYKDKYDDRRDRGDRDFDKGGRGGGYSSYGRGGRGGRDREPYERDFKVTYFYLKEKGGSNLGSPTTELKHVVDKFGGDEENWGLKKFTNPKKSETGSILNSPALKPSSFPAEDTQQNSKNAKNVKQNLDRHNMFSLLPTD